MSNLKRFLAMTLVMVMMVGALAMTASARFFDDVLALKDDNLTAAIDLLSELGIARGTSTDNFSPENDVTRQQFALFVSRMHTATPEYFVPSTSEKDIPRFKDVVDNTYFTAINYCYDNKIIDGSKAPTDGNNDGEFNPEGTIIFQEAITMLVRALGYANAGLSYPVGFLAKGREIGLIDGGAGAFDLTNMKANDTVTREDMAKLLYNYFLCDYYEVQMLWNQPTAREQQQVVYKPVSEKFGITKITGYVTAIEGAAIPMIVEDQYSWNYNYGYDYVQFAANPIPRKTADANTPGNYNLEISWVTDQFENITTTSTNNIPVYDSTGAITGYVQVGSTAQTRRTATLRTTKAKLGLDEDYKGIAGSRELLGLKVVAFVNTSAANKNIPLPKTQVKGTKTSNITSFSWSEVEEKDERFTLRHNTKLSFETNGEHGKTTVDNKPDARILNSIFSEENIYVISSNENNGIAKPLAGPAGANILPANSLHTTASNINFMLGNIYTKGQFTFDYIDNGVNTDGSYNYAIIYTPYVAAMKTDRNDDQWNLVYGNGQTFNIQRRGYTTTLDSVAFTGKDFTDNNDHHGFLISRQGEFVLIHGDRLVELSDNAYASNITANEVSLTRTVASQSLADLKVNYNARATFYRTSNNRTTVNGSTFTGAVPTTVTTGLNAQRNAYGINLNDTFRVFAVASVNPNYGYVGGNSGEFFLFKKATAVADTAKQYGYVLSETGSNYVASNGSVMTTYTVYNIGKGTQEQINDVNSNITTYKRGDQIAFYYQNSAPNTALLASIMSVRIIGRINPWNNATTGNTPATEQRYSAWANFTETLNFSYDTGTNNGRRDLRYRVLPRLLITAVDNATGMTNDPMASNYSGGVINRLEALATQLTGQLNSLRSAMEAPGYTGNALTSPIAYVGAAADQATYSAYVSNIIALINDTNALATLLRGYEAAIQADFLANRNDMTSATTWWNNNAGALTSGLQYRVLTSRIGLAVSAGGIATANTNANTPLAANPAAATPRADILTTVSSTAANFSGIRGALNEVLTLINGERIDGGGAVQALALPSGADDAFWTTFGIINTDNATSPALVTTHLPYSGQTWNGDSSEISGWNTTTSIGFGIRPYQNGSASTVQYLTVRNMVVAMANARAREDMAVSAQTNGNVNGANILNVNPATTPQLDGTSFLETGESGWYSIGGNIRNVTPTASIFGGFQYNTTTFTASVGGGVNLGTQWGLTANISPNTLIFIFDVQNMETGTTSYINPQYNRISRDQLATLWLSNTAIRSATMVARAGTATVLYIGVNSNDTTRALFNRVNTSSTYLIVQSVSPYPEVVIDGVAYYKISAVDQATGATNSNILISAAGTLYSNITVGTWIYLDSSATLYDAYGTLYRVAQLYSTNTTAPITAATMTDTLWNNTRRVVSGSYVPGTAWTNMTLSSNVQTVDGSWKTVVGENVLFINLQLTLRDTLITAATSTTSAITQYEVVSVTQTFDENTLNVTQPTSTTGYPRTNIDTFTLNSKAHNWTGFGSMIQSTATTWNTTRLSSATGVPARVAGGANLIGWYVLPNPNNNNGYVVVYVSSVTVVN